MPKHINNLALGSSSMAVQWVVVFLVDHTIEGLGVIMLKEQLLGFAVKALSQAYETKERIKNSLPSQLVQDYAKNVKNKVSVIIEHGLTRLGTPNVKTSLTKNNTTYRAQDSASKKLAKKIRKSSIKPAKEIGSLRAEVILERIRNNNVRLVEKHESIDGKKSLAFLVWALGQAELAELAEGISIHDISSLLYRACNIELYPINISRVVFSNPSLVQQAGQENRTKTYLLTPKGKALFREKFLA
jgi:hypothetical protein